MQVKYILTAAAGFIIGALIMTWWFTPKIVAWIPEGDFVSSMGAIGLELNKPVTAAEAAAYLSIDPTAEGEYWTEGNVIWYDTKNGFDYNQVYTITLASGIKAENGLRSLKSYEKNFQILEPELIFLQEDNEAVNIWHRSDGSAAEQFTNESEGIWDYNTSPDGQGIIVSVIDDDRSDDLVYIGLDGHREIFVECNNFRCSDGRQQPGGRLIAYERHGLDGSANESEVWLKDLDTGSEWPAYNPDLTAQSGFDSLESKSPRWSKDGQYLAYYKPDARLIIIQPVSGDESILIPANLQLLGEWSPVNNQIAYIEQTIVEQEINDHQDEENLNDSHTQPILYNHLVVADIATGEVVDLSEGESISDGAPAWHPDGLTIAIPRENGGGGRQIWFVESEGKQWSKITNDPLYHHAGLSWSQDGARLALMRMPIGDTRPSAEVQLFDPECGEMTLISESAFLPGWLP